MAPATIESSVGEHEISAAASILRNDDLLSQALRDGITLDVDEIIHLSRAVPSSQDTLSSVGSTSTMVFSCRGESTATKPTSADTDHPTNTHKNKRKHRLKEGYASSLSVAYGSASEAEVERMTLRRSNLMALGDWADAELEHARPLKGMVRARDRQQDRRKAKQKKPIIFVEQNSHAELSSCVAGAAGQSEERGLMLTTTPSYGGTDTKYLRHRSPNHSHDPVSLAEEGQPYAGTDQCMESGPLSGARLYILAGITVLKVMTVAVSAYCAYLSGKTHVACTKGIIFAATGLMAIFTVVGMLVAKQALSEALLAGLIEFVLGFAFVVGLEDFM